MLWTKLWPQPGLLSHPGSLQSAPQRLLSHPGGPSRLQAWPRQQWSVGSGWGLAWPCPASLGSQSEKVPPPPPITSLPSREFGTVLSTSQSYHHLSRGAGGWRKPRFLGKLHLPGLPLRVIWGGQLQRITAAAIFLWFPRMRFSVLSPPPPTRTSLKGKKTLFWEAEALSPPPPPPSRVKALVLRRKPHLTYYIVQLRYGMTPGHLNTGWVFTTTYFILPLWGMERYGIGVL